MNFKDLGSPHQTPVVLIHAFPFQEAMWEEQVAVLKNNYRVITFDIRGLGKSQSQGAYTLEMVVDDLIQLLDQLKIEKCVVGGLSMGGYVALRAVERNPERFQAAVFADTKSEADGDQAKLARYKSLKAIQENFSAFVDGFIKNSVAPQTKPEIIERLQKMAKSNSPNGVKEALLALVSRTDTTEELSKIKIPTLVIHGELDTIIPLASAKTLKEKIPNAKLVVIPGAGHLSNVENPTEFNENLMGFLKEL